MEKTIKHNPAGEHRGTGVHDPAGVHCGTRGYDPAEKHRGTGGYDEKKQKLKNERSGSFPDLFITACLC